MIERNRSDFANMLAALAHGAEGHCLLAGQTPNFEKSLQFRIIILKAGFKKLF
jgi:hypothetical protein